MGCLSRIGCLVVVAGAGAVGWWLYGDQLPSKISHAAGRAADAVQRATGDAPSDSVGRRTTAVDPTDRLAWASVEITAGTAPNPLAPLSEKNGPAFVSLGAADVAVLLARSLPQQLPKSATNVRIAMEGDLLLARAVIDVTEIAGDGTLGRLLGTALAGRDTIGFAGPVELIQPGTAQFQITKLRVKGFDVPPRLIPMYMRALRRGARVDEVTDDGFVVALPANVGDVRLSNGKLTLYKAVPTP